ncbi:MAG: hypothetical protein WBG92_02530 [Thiohalocapsa sp.]
MPKNRTTADLRDMLFDAMEPVRDGSMASRDAKAIADLADKILDSAEMELKYSQVVSRLDKEDQGVSPGPLLLT